MQEENKNIFMAFGERLRFIREKLDLNQKEFAIKLGFASYKAISRFEKGERLPNAKALISLAALGPFNLHWLITGKPSPDGETWRENYGELFSMYSSDGGLWIDRLRGEIADLNKEIIELSEKESRGEKVEGIVLSNKRELMHTRQNQLDHIKERLKQAIDRLGGIRIEY